MESSIIITFCVLLLLAYLFDITSSLTKIPSVILLLVLGWIVRQLTILFWIPLPDISPALPVLGTIGLILIVLEGSLELELHRSKLGLMVKSFVGALFPMLVLSFILAFLFYYFGNHPFRVSLINAIPLSVISSAIAIPSVRHLFVYEKEFIIYESSLSDIIGVLFFNFIILNENFSTLSVGHFGLQILIITIVSFVSTIGLSFLLGKIDHHIKFVPIILLIILIYAVSKVYHLPALIFILFFGLFIGNFDELKRFKWVRFFRPNVLDMEVRKLKELTIEGAFVVRSLFFLLFGYLIETAHLLNTATEAWAFGIVLLILIVRTVQMKLSKLPMTPLLFIAPRGLISILLFLSIEPAQKIVTVNKSLIMQVIILTSLVMMVGLMLSKKKA